MGLRFAISLMLLFGQGINLVAQPYPIPNAQKQPAWVFPIWFENAHGERDTIYLGYDSTSAPLSIDSLFGEKWQKVETNVFNVFWNDILFGDSIMKVMVRPKNSFDNLVTISATQGWLPMKMSWDVSLLHSDSLPYPDQGTAPRAEGLLWMNGIAVTEPHDDLGCSSFGDHPVLVTDSISIPGGALATCVRRDSIVFTELYSLDFEVRPWSGRWLYTEPENKVKPKARLSPNPFKEQTTLIVDDYMPSTEYDFVIYDITGRELRRQEIVSAITVVGRGGLPCGIYFYSIRDQGKVFFAEKFMVR